MIRLLGWSLLTLAALILLAVIACCQAEGKGPR